MKGRFEPLRDKYALLARFEVQASEQEAALLETLEPEHEAFGVVIEEASVTVEKAKDLFR